VHTQTDGDGPDTAADDRGGVATTDGGSAGAATGDTDEGGAESGPRGDAALQTGTPGLGRRILLSVGALVIVISGGLGWFVGSNGQLRDAAVLGTGITVPVTPVALAAYGIVVSTVILGGLFALVELASRIEADSGAE